jgi:hypothetical protein
MVESDRIGSSERRRDHEIDGINADWSIVDVSGIARQVNSSSLHTLELRILMAKTTDITQNSHSFVERLEL